jgi:hypothetical protein
VKTEAALVGTQCAVELDPEAAVDMNIAFIILPGYPEDDLTLRLADPLDDLALQILGVLGHDRPEGLQHLLDRLVELHFAGVALQYVLVDAFKFFVQLCHVLPPDGMERMATPTGSVHSFSNCCAKSSPSRTKNVQMPA